MIDPPCQVVASVTMAPTILTAEARIHTEAQIDTQMDTVNPQIQTPSNGGKVPVVLETSASKDLESQKEGWWRRAYTTKEQKFLLKLDFFILYDISVTDGRC